jgi:hypothetical protein
MLFTATLLLGGAVLYWIVSHGGSAGQATPVPGLIVSWQAPQRFSDGETLDPARDLSYFEIYVNDTGTFAAGDSPRTLIPAVTVPMGEPVTSFDLSAVVPPLQKGRTYYLSMRSIDRKGVRSVLALPPVRFVY